jgi:hypothetical protein
MARVRYIFADVFNLHPIFTVTYINATFRNLNFHYFSCYRWVKLDLHKTESDTFVQGCDISKIALKKEYFWEKYFMQGLKSIILAVLQNR